MAYLQASAKPYLVSLDGKLSRLHSLTLYIAVLLYYRFQSLKFKSFLCVTNPKNSISATHRCRRGIWYKPIEVDVSSSLHHLRSCRRMQQRHFRFRYVFLSPQPRNHSAFCLRFCAAFAQDERKELWIIKVTTRCVKNWLNGFHWRGKTVAQVIKLFLLLGLCIWKSLWEHTQPEVLGFSTPVKAKRVILKAQRKQLKVNFNADIYLGMQN